MAAATPAMLPVPTVAARAVQRAWKGEIEPFSLLWKVLEPVKNVMTEDGQVVCLIKPQFEAGREKVGKKGVVRDKSVHLEVIEMVIAYAQSLNFEIKNLEFSPIKGPEGNIEYLLHLQNSSQGIAEHVDPAAIVEEAHKTLS